MFGYYVNLLIKKDSNGTNGYKFITVSVVESVALSCFQDFIKSFLGNSARQVTYKLREELLRKINRTSRNNLVPHSVSTLKLEKNFNNKLCRYKTHTDPCEPFEICTETLVAWFQ